MLKRISVFALLFLVIVGSSKPARAQSQGVLELLQQLRAEVAELRDDVKPRHFYLTRDEFTGANALDACGVGFHMASLWEIFDPTNLTYDTTLGVTQADSGEGPPSGLDGWIRTGSRARALSSIEPGNCLAWTTNGPTFSGAAVRLTETWFPYSKDDPNFPALRPVESEILPWVASNTSCISTVRVWCVQDR